MKYLSIGNSPFTAEVLKECGVYTPSPFDFSVTRADTICNNHNLMHLPDEATTFVYIAYADINNEQNNHYIDSYTILSGFKADIEKKHPNLPCEFLLVHYEKEYVDTPRVFNHTLSKENFKERAKKIIQEHVESIGK